MTQTGRKSAYAKVTARSADDWPALGIAVSIGPGDARIAVGAATETAMRLPHTEALLAGKHIDDKLLREICESCRVFEATDDVHAPAAYRQHLAVVLSRRALEQARARLPSGAATAGTPAAGAH